MDHQSHLTVITSVNLTGQGEEKQLKQCTNQETVFEYTTCICTWPNLTWQRFFLL